MTSGSNLISILSMTSPPYLTPASSMSCSFYMTSATILNSMLAMNYPSYMTSVSAIKLCILHGY